MSKIVLHISNPCILVPETGNSCKKQSNTQILKAYVFRPMFLQNSGSIFQVQASSLKLLRIEITSKYLFRISVCEMIFTSPKNTFLIFLQFCKTSIITFDFISSTFELFHWLENSELEFRKSKSIAKWVVKLVKIECKILKIL